MLKQLKPRLNKPATVAIQHSPVLEGDCEGGWDDLERRIIKVLRHVLYRHLRSDATTLGLALGNVWKIEGSGMSRSDIADLWHSRTPGK